MSADKTTPLTQPPLAANQQRRISRPIHQQPRPFLGQRPATGKVGGYRHFPSVLGFERKDCANSTARLYLNENCTHMKSTC